MDFQKSMKKKKCVLYLIQTFLLDNGFKQSAECLHSEANLSSEYVICDNIRLDTIFTEYELYYYQRFKIYPQVYKKVVSFDSKQQLAARHHKLQHSKNIVKNITQTAEYEENSSDLVVIGSRKNQHLQKTNETILKSISDNNEIEDTNSIDENYKLQIIQTISNPNTNISWSDVKGLKEQKELLKEAIIYPSKYPNLFMNEVEPWQSILMYGPPGTGKTLLAKSLANECSATFFKISCSSIVSKWRGDSEKRIKALFEIAYCKSPSVIFIDEIDAIASKRCVQEHEASQRMKSELFISIDELMSRNKSVFLLATTNIPWDLDERILRRFEKHIYISLPDYETRLSLLKKFLPQLISLNPRIEIELDYSDLAQYTEHYSGNDMKNICKEIKMSLMREILTQIEMKKNQVFHSKKRRITRENFNTALRKYKPILKNTENEYIKWRMKND